MKLRLVSARTGLSWVREGMRTFARQPLALTGLFFLYLAAISITAQIPWIGGILALGLLPAASLGLMAATREAASGHFPMPTLLLSAFRAGRERLSAMVTLGAIYAAGFVFNAAVSALADHGHFARYMLNGQVTQQATQQSDFQLAMWIFMLLCIPLSLLFWHAPALVHWHGQPPVKSLFFSLVACWRNKGALLVFALTWLGLFVAAAVLLGLVSVAMGSTTFANVAMLPTVLLFAVVYFSSVYFSFRDSFVAEDPQP